MKNEIIYWNKWFEADRIVNLINILKNLRVNEIRRSVSYNRMKSGMENSARKCTENKYNSVFGSWSYSGFCILWEDHNCPDI